MQTLTHPALGLESPSRIAGEGANSEAGEELVTSVKLV